MHRAAGLANSGRRPESRGKRPFVPSAANLGCEPILPHAALDIPTLTAQECATTMLPPDPMHHERIPLKDRRRTVMQSCTFDEIMRTANLVPFEAEHTKSLIKLLKKQHEKGLIVRFHPEYAPTAAAALDGMTNGYFVLTCPQINSDLVFTCENGGKGLFGGQKRIFKVFLADVGENDFSAISSFKSFIIAITSINNIFRHAGLLVGTV